MRQNSNELAAGDNLNPHAIWKSSSSKVVTNILGALFAFAAAAFGYKASAAIVRQTESADRDGWKSAQITFEHETIVGAMAASIAAAIQGIALMLPD